MGATPLICIIDDAADYRFLVQTIFRRFFPENQVRFFSGGKEFVQELPKMTERPGLILLDRHMPDLDGHQLLLLLKQDPVYKTIPVVMLSSDASADEVNRCYEAGVNSFLSKPTEFDQLKEMMSLISRYWLGINLPVN
ncbi:response regulator [Larkinella knui]|uniref:Response regulator n=1 Tax=Larkinella knui TaxID=2025310 RepID=A0A3P1CYR1_9BACT|nr:response regulator [Larkinella knui]RRB18014.1 response regulator [Larkinella knui]